MSSVWWISAFAAEPNLLRGTWWWQLSNREPAHQDSERPTCHAMPCDGLAQKIHRRILWDIPKNWSVKSGTSVLSVIPCFRPRDFWVPYGTVFFCTPRFGFHFSCTNCHVDPCRPFQAWLVSPHSLRVATRQDFVAQAMIVNSSCGTQQQQPYPSEKYESQWEGLSHILWKNVPNHQPDKHEPNMSHAMRGRRPPAARS